MPPFAEPATAQETRSPPPKHPNAEHFINATAKHIVPDVPAPSASQHEDGAEITKPEEDEDQREEREEEPLLKGTPLDELLTPGLGQGAPAMSGVNEEGDDRPDQREGRMVDKGKTIVKSDDRPDTRQQPGRPGFGAMRGVGSDSVSRICRCALPL